MTEDHNPGLSIWPDLIEKIRARTPARVLADRTGASYRTVTQLQLRHGPRRGARCRPRRVRLEKRFGLRIVEQWKLFTVLTMAASKEEYLAPPRPGTVVCVRTREGQLAARCPLNADLQIVIGDGLSVTAVSRRYHHCCPCWQKRRAYAGGRWASHSQ